MHRLLLASVVALATVACEPPAKCIKGHYETRHVPAEESSVICLPQVDSEGYTTIDCDYDPGHPAYDYQQHVCDMYEGGEKVEQ